MPNAPSQKSKTRIQKRKLGNSNLQVSAIGFGCMGLDFGYANKVSRQEGIALIRAACECPMDENLCLGSEFGIATLSATRLLRRMATNESAAEQPMQLSRSRRLAQTSVEDIILL